MRVDSILRCQIKKMEVNHINPEYIDDSSVGEDVEVMYFETGSSEKHKPIDRSTQERETVSKLILGTEENPQFQIDKPENFPNSSSNHKEIQA